MKKTIVSLLYASPWRCLSIFALLFLGALASVALGRGALGLVMCVLLGLYTLFVYAIPLMHILSYGKAPKGDADAPGYLFVDFVLEKLRASAEDSVSRRSMEQLNEIANIKLLQSQISPHFLYNTLDSVRGELYMCRMYELADMVEALSCIFRFNIDQKKMLIPFEEELRNTEKYVQIMQFRFANKFQFLKQFDETDENIMNYSIPKLTLQPIVENAIHHGLETKIGTGLISLHIRYTDATMLISIEDDGSGMDSETLRRINEQVLKPSGEDADGRAPTGSGSGIALRNINERICLLYGEAYGLSVASSPSRGTQVMLMLPRHPSNPFETRAEG